MNKFSKLLQSCRLFPVLFLFLSLASETQGKAYFYEEAGCQEGKSAIFTANIANAEFPVLLTGDDCCKGSKPVSLTLQYTGEGCGATDTSQKPGKYSCHDSGAGPNGAASVYIVASEKSNAGGKIYFTGNVALGSSFTVTTTDKFKSNTWFSIYASQNGALLQRVQIHTSCSAPLVLGEQIGSLILENVVFQDGTSCQSAPPPPPPPPSDECPQPVIEVLTDELCAGEAIEFKTPDLGIPCLVYSWNFGQDASPQTATGIGPHAVTYSSTGTPTVSLNINNDCAGGTGTALCPTSPPPGGGTNCFKIDPPKSGTSNGVTYTVTNQGGEPKFLTVTGAGIVSVNVKGGPVSVTYTNPPYTNLTAPINPNNGTPYGISHFTICVESGGNGGGGGGGGGGGTDCCTSGNKPKGLTLKYTGEGCAATNTTQSPGKYSCNDSNGGPNGAATVFIKANDSSTGTGTNYFSGTVALGTDFSINSPSGTLKSNTWLLIYNQEGGTLLQKVQIHTSCSVPIVPGEQFGSLKLLGVTYENGDICGDNSGGTPDCLDCDKTTTVTLEIEDCKILGEIGDRVWFDENGNGLQDDNDEEKGIAGVPVILMNCDGDVLKVEFTDINGEYLFDNLPAGFYKLSFTNIKPGEYIPTILNAGNDDTIDSDADINGNTGCIELGPGESNRTIDAGFKPLAPPCSINPSATSITCTDNGTPDPADDLFTFVLTVSGTNAGTGWSATINNVNVSGFYNTPILLGPYPISGGTVVFDIVDNETATCKTNLAVVPPAPCSQPLPGKIGDLVWYDLNGNGLKDGDEEGIPDVTVVLENCQGGVLKTTQTDPEGKYCFENLQPGDYRVSFQNPGTFEGNFLEFTDQNVGNDTNIDSDADANGLTACITLGQGKTNLTIDAGLKPVPCSNVTYGGKIGHKQSACGPYDPEEIVSLALPIGGTGEIEYRWLQSTTGCPNSFTQAIANSNSPNYDPATISETTWYVRQARRIGCTQWVETNCIQKEVLNCGGTNNCGVTISVAQGTITVERQGGPAAGIQVFNSDYSATIFSCGGNCNNPQVIAGLTPGTYIVKVDATWNPDCQVEETVIVPVQLGSGGSSNLGTPTGNGNLPTGSLENLADLEVYPNPAKGSALVRWNTQTDWQQATLTVFNQLGQQVQLVKIEDLASGNYRLDLNNMNDGQYFIHFRADGQTPIVKKLTVKR